MKNKFSEKLIEIWDKLKKNKRLLILLLIALILVILLLYFSFKPSSNRSTKTEDTSQTQSYANSLEEKLETSLKSIDGVTDVSVLITLETGFEYVYAQEELTKQTATGSQTSTSLVLVSGQPVIVKEIYPKIKGVVIISSGAKDVKTRLNILSVIQTVLEISNDRITIVD